MEFRASNVGICGISVYTPHCFVDQAELEHFDDVSSGKYTIGLGQKKMGFCSFSEDSASMALTVTSNLMSKYGVCPQNVGRLEVGTESMIDKSKSIKSILMTLFPASCHDIEGIDSYNACFGGTQAVLNAVNWVESASWSTGQYAIVVATDIACYSPGPARCTGGAGAVAMLIGEDASIVFDQGLRAFHMDHVYDFYKPLSFCEYPVVDGALSVQSYLKCLDHCYQLYREKFGKKFPNDPAFSVSDSVSAALFHSPYTRLVQKSLARLCWHDDIKVPFAPGDAMEINDNYEEPQNRYTPELEKKFLNESKDLFQRITSPSLGYAREVGNMYTASIWSGLASFVADKSTTFSDHQRVLLFSYGSGCASCMFSATLREGSHHSTLLEVAKSDVSSLNDREKVPPETFTQILSERQHWLRSKSKSESSMMNGLCMKISQHSEHFLRPSTYYLSDIDSQFRRHYSIFKS